MSYQNQSTEELVSQLITDNWERFIERIEGQSDSSMGHILVELDRRLCEGRNATEYGRECDHRRDLVSEFGR